MQRLRPLGNKVHITKKKIFRGSPKNLLQIILHEIISVQKATRDILAMAIFHCQQSVQVCPHDL